MQQLAPLSLSSNCRGSLPPFWLFALFFALVKSHQLCLTQSHFPALKCPLLSASREKRNILALFIASPSLPGNRTFQFVLSNVWRRILTARPRYVMPTTPPLFCSAPTDLTGLLQSLQSVVGSRNNSKWPVLTRLSSRPIQLAAQQPLKQQRQAFRFNLSWILAIGLENPPLLGFITGRWSLDHPTWLRALYFAPSTMPHSG